MSLNERPAMRRVVATPPEGLAELCVMRLGIQAHRLGAIPFLFRMTRAIDRAVAEALKSNVGLLASEKIALNWRHFGVIQYWTGFDALEAWSHSGAHAEWWRELVARSRQRQDVGVYHETYLVAPDRLESIYLDCLPVGLSAFGVLHDAVGPRTTSRDRLGRRGSRS